MERKGEKEVIEKEGVCERSPMPVPLLVLMTPQIAANVDFTINEANVATIASAVAAADVVAAPGY